MTFSERMGYTNKRPIQIESMDKALRNSLFNVARSYLLVGLEYQHAIPRQQYIQKYDAAWEEFFKEPLHFSPSKYLGSKDANSYIYNFFHDSKWNVIYDFVEYLVRKSEGELIKPFNEVLEREVAGYRVIESMVVPVTDTTQIDEIVEGIKSTEKEPLKGTNEHLKTALQFLSDRLNPNYRNSIKESISAVESVASALSGKQKAKLKDALKILEEKERLHPALKDAFVKLYGWSSDDEGIRHALMDESKLCFADALFMLVACSAFVHYLVTIKAS